MSRFWANRNRLAIVAGLLALVPQLAPAQGPEPRVGQFFTVVEPINDDLIQAIKASAQTTIDRAASKGQRPILIFEFLPGAARPGQSSFGASSDLQDLIANRLAGARQTVAFVPKPLSGYAVLGVLACDEVVMGPEATLGPITPEGGQVTARERETVRALAERKGRDADLLLGLLDPDADLRRIRTADRTTHYVLAANLPEFQKTHRVLENQPAWEGGRRGVLAASQAREAFVRLLADDRAKVAEAYQLPSTSDDPTLGGPARPILIRVQGRVDSVQESYLKRRLRQARGEGVNLIVLALDTEDADQGAADKIADAIARLEGAKTVAFIDDRATGASSLLALACDQIIVRKGGRMGETSPEARDERDTAILADRAEALAKQNGHPSAVARALVDPEIEVFSARDTKTGSVAFVTGAQIAAEPDRFQARETVKGAGEPFAVTSENAERFGMASTVVDDLDGLKAALLLGGATLRLDQPTWVDSLVALLNTPVVSLLLLFLGMFMLILELKLPGVGLPAIISALSFLLFFWGHFMGGTADGLEILLFVVGVVCLALELFVFPGFGVFGGSGVLLILASVVMASHTFVWPSQEYEYRQMGRTLLQVTLALVAVIVGAIVLGRYFPALPLFSRMVLKPEVPGDDDELGSKPPLDPDAPLFYLLGEIGRTTTVLKPSGKARFGEQLVDVTADGFYIEADQPVEVVEVRGSRVIVKRA